MLNVSPSPMAVKVFSRKSQSTQSKAFSASKLRNIDGWLVFIAIDCIFNVLLMLFVPYFNHKKDIAMNFEANQCIFIQL